MHWASHLFWNHINEGSHCCRLYLAFLLIETQNNSEISSCWWNIYWKIKPNIERKVKVNVIKLNRNTFNTVHKQMNIPWREGNCNVFKNLDNCRCLIETFYSFFHLLPNIAVLWNSTNLKVMLRSERRMKAKRMQN